MLYNPRYLLPPDGLPSALAPCQPARSLNGLICKNFRAVVRSRTFFSTYASAPISSSVSAEHGRAAIADQLSGRSTRAEGWPDAGEGVGTAALQTDLQMGDRFFRTLTLPDLGQPFPYDRFPDVQI